MKDKPDGKHARLEKYLLRKAFDTPENPYLPDEVLYRQKEQVGVHNSQSPALGDYESCSHLAKHALWPCTF